MVQSERRASWAAGGTTFAACLMVMVGVWQVILGIAAIAEDEVFVTTPNYVLQFDLTQWGWTHLIIGALAAVTGAFIFTGRAWARWTGILLAVLSATAQFFWMPYQPFWAMMVIAIDVFVIWALAASSTAAESEYDGYRAAEAPDWQAKDTQPGEPFANPGRTMYDRQDEAAPAMPTDPAARTERRPSDQA
ncbi:hypothetical protein SAMN05216298_2051 [Glycomyces sambucus]|uniref:DUF7144 domain-containing protein n=1 Tax=Glycomyces sambucus TaxID=380244 RepID=A0A1G9FVA5_9ACTN|nr:hypothetical protein [Glycomyces sambucus]SDK92320.1 hypothetical protein SAMN05216298_2051 [Glycomyces sambucus]